MTKTKITKALDTIDAAARAQVQELADRFREERLLPFCKRHQLTYLAGNGSFAFYRKSEAVYAWNIGCSYLRPMNEILNAYVLGSILDLFGFYISDITEQDIAP